MPTYEYKCPKCGHRFESFKPVHDPEANCPICGNKTQKDKKNVRPKITQKELEDIIEKSSKNG